MRILGPLLALAVAACHGPAVGESGRGQTSAELDQRRRALVAHWLDNARMLRASGELAAAKLELLKATDMDRHNRVVATELQAIRNEMGAERFWPMDCSEGSPRLHNFRGARARATVDRLLQRAASMSVSGDHDGALEELERERSMELEVDVDWGELPTRMKEVRKQVESRRSR